MNNNTAGYNSFTSSKADQLYAKETTVFVNTYNDPNHKQRFDKLVDMHKQASEINEVILRGKSDNPGIVLGGTVTIMSGDNSKGTFRVTKISHTTNHEGNYENIFEGVTADMAVSPLSTFETYPQSSSQIAKVTDNADPESMSRIQVQFPWQEHSNTTTPWLR